MHIITLEAKSQLLQDLLTVAFLLYFPYDIFMDLKNNQYFQALLVLFSFLLVFFWQNSPLGTYSGPMIGFLVFLFLLISFKNKNNLNFGGPINFFILNSVTLLLIFMTGGIESDLFTILYFLLFAASFIMDPRVVFIIPLGVIIVFWSQIFEGETLSNFIKIGSLILLTPLAYFFGKQFKNSDQQNDEVIKTKERAVDAADEISKDVKDVVESANNKLTDTEMNKLNEILEETEDLRQEKKS